MRVRYDILKANKREEAYKRARRGAEVGLFADGRQTLAMLWYVCGRVLPTILVLIIYYDGCAGLAFFLRATEKCRDDPAVEGRGQSRSRKYSAMMSLLDSDDPQEAGEKLMQILGV